METIVKTRSLQWLLLAGAWLGTGCASRPPMSVDEPNAPSPPVQMLCQSGVTMAEVVQAAERVLTRMHFAIEKLDAEQGIVKTRPLRGAQFFEFWRSDNASSYAWQEANLQSIRRTVELRVRNEAGDRRPEAGGADSLPPATSGLLCLECVVSVQRLDLPENEVAGASEGYQVRSRSTAALQRIQISPQQRRAMTWIDLGEDRDLAARVLDRIAKRLAD
jgi:hypothetical protein